MTGLAFELTAVWLLDLQAELKKLGQGSRLGVDDVLNAQAIRGWGKGPVQVCFCGARD